MSFLATCLHTSPQHLLWHLQQLLTLSGQPHSVDMLIGPLARHMRQLQCSRQWCHLSSCLPCGMLLRYLSLQAMYQHPLKQHGLPAQAAICLLLINPQGQPLSTRPSLCSAALSNHLCLLISISVLPSSTDPSLWVINQGQHHHC